jgi:hypothetical protein
MTRSYPIQDDEPPADPYDSNVVRPDDWSQDGDEPRAFRQGTVLARSELKTLPRVQALVAGVLSYPAAVVLVGSYGTGKTTLVHGIAASVATGRRWLGREVQRRRVLIVVGEGAYGLDDRISAWEHAWQNGDPISDEQITFLVKPSSLAKHTAWAEITAYAVAGGYGFVVLDTFSSLAPDADETKDAAQVMRWLSDLSASIDGTALLVHHPGWSDSSRVRGGYQFEANADEVLVLTGTEGSELVCLTRKKVKDGVSGATIWLRRRPLLHSVVMQTAQPDELDVPLRERIVSVLAGYAEIGATGPQLVTEIGVEDKNRSSFYKALEAARTADLIVGIGSARRQRYYLAEHEPKDTK